MKALELRIPPPAVTLAFALAMWLAARALPLARAPFPRHHLVAAVLLAAGLITSILGMRAFARAGTTINPMRPGNVSSLVVTGIYGLSRNPMYLGLLTILLAWAALLANPATLILVGLFVLYMNRFQIDPEERVLSERFGAAFSAYRKAVRRWI
jgi:protein-S-isoprenylcysteine O-methyltransferase Ste14